MTPKERVDRILAEAVGSDLTSWEKFEFLPVISKLSYLTPRREEALRAIEIKVFGEEDE